jgi:hypothetical protein
MIFVSIYCLYDTNEPYSRYLWTCPSTPPPPRANGTAVGPIGLRPRDGSPRRPGHRQKVKRFCIHWARRRFSFSSTVRRLPGALSGFVGIRNVAPSNSPDAHQAALPVSDQSGSKQSLNPNPVRSTPPPRSTSTCSTAPRMDSDSAATQKGKKRKGKWNWSPVINSILLAFAVG